MTGRPYALFLGCSVPVRAQNYEASVRRVAPLLGVLLEDLAGSGCCGYPMEPVSAEASLVMAARSLAIAAGRGMDVCALCSACGGHLMEAAHALEDPARLKAANASLAKAGGQGYPGGVEVRHVAEILSGEGPVAALRAGLKRRLSGVRVAVHYGCHYLRPREIHAGHDDPEAPRTIEDLVSAAGATPVAYEGRLRCCGGGILGIDESTALAITRRKLDAVALAGADCMVVVCPFCSVMLEGNQKRVEKIAGREYGLPVLYLTQLLGFALGLDPADLGFSSNRIKATALLAKIGA